MNDIFEGCDFLTFPGCEAALTRTVFTAEKVKSARLDITGLGYFEAYINGKAVSGDKYAPAMSDYEKRDLTGTHMPTHDELSHRIYYLSYDVGELLTDGENVLGVHVGAGWYGQTKSRNEGMPFWGDNMLVFILTLTAEDGGHIYIRSSAENTVWKPSYILETQLYFGEYHNMRKYEDGWNRPGFTENGWCKPVLRQRPDAVIQKADFPSDRVISHIIPEAVYSFGDTKIYDLGRYAAGYAVICFNDSAWMNDTASVRYADERKADGSLEFHYCGSEARMQKDYFAYNDECECRELYPHFTWHAGRYFEVTGRADVLRFEEVHTDIRQVSSFTSDNETLNWIFNAYVLTQKTNIHGCIPSDCPHRERLGYTGDGQLTCGAVMSVFDAREMYRKWMRDILDCQDKKGGHVQHTAPFYGGGGGPGGWGGAICIVPYRYYKFYGDKSLLADSYSGMKAYLGYMECHSENGIVVRGEKGGWCLGDWCPPHNDVKIPEKFVNTYFYIKCIDITAKTAGLLGFEDEKTHWENESKRVRARFNECFYDENTGSYCGGIQGADAFALDISEGTEKTLQNFTEKYEKQNGFDTGIFGTDLTVKMLFKHGYADAAIRLLTNETENSFYNMKKHGATTLWENWDGCDSRCHPMFGAVVRYFFEYILGIQKTGDGCYTVSPIVTDRLKSFSGTYGTPDGSISVLVHTDESGKRKTEIANTGNIIVREKL
ncbi:MAG: alpha-L-rhamnosidase N-terminal domain-containing protein [Clostridia bacterium]|nr:alpha-L-rhamnosidase N-terminal domain-containing protein [Clostridia bacterium]